MQMGVSSKRLGQKDWITFDDVEDSTSTENENTF